MLLTISTTHRPATDLGYLLHKTPARLTFGTSFGQAHVFYPEARETRCAAAVLVEVDPVALVRSRNQGTAAQYVNDRPWVLSSFVSVAVAEVFGTALGGRSKERPELAASAIPLEATLAVVPARGSEDLLRRLFEPLGYEVAPRTIPIGDAFPGEGRHYEVRLSAVCRLLLGKCEETPLGYTLMKRFAASWASGCSPHASASLTSTGMPASAEAAARAVPMLPRP